MTPRTINRISLAVLWLVSGLLPLHPIATAQGLAAIQHLISVPTATQHALMYLGMVVDVVFAVLCLRWDKPPLWSLQIGVIAVYTLLLSVALPELWLHPFGPLLKNLPIIALLYSLARTPRESS